MCANVGSSEASRVAPQNDPADAVPDQGTKRGRRLPYNGHCAGCNRDSSAFKSNRLGLNVPAVDRRMIDFPFESAVNNRICGACYSQNWLRLNAKRLREDEVQEEEEEGDEMSSC